MNYEEIYFDISRDGLVLLLRILESHYETETPELQNFTNHIRGMVERAPAVVQESSWLDE